MFPWIWYRSRANVALKIINFLRGEGKLLDEKKNYRYVNDFICLVAVTIYSWVEKSDSFNDGVAGSKKDWATEKSRVTNGVNSSTRNSLIGVSDISFRRCTERGVERGRAGSRKPSTDHCPPNVSPWTPLWRSRIRQKTASSCQRASFC